MRVFISSRAKLDLLRIYRYLGERNPNAADNLLGRIDANFENLVRFPFIGKERSSLGPGIRCLIVGFHLVFYTLDPEQITVVRVIDGRMDVDEEFHR
jgi:toxin ParE1/3/4